MLRHEDNEALTRVGAGTPMGRFMRRYWIPAAKLEQIAEPGGAPVRVKLLGESLVVFRDPNGKVGLIGEYCPHRGASLVYGRNEEDGLRCLYHGWKMGCGFVLESPPQPPARTFANKLAHISYPVREAGQLLWTYMGPPELEPPFPKFPWLNLPESHLLVVKMHQATNYLQGVEGDLDPAHPNYLHRDFDLDDSESWAGAGWQSIATLMSDGAPVIHCEETPYLMRVGAVRNLDDNPNEKYIRSYEWVAPFYCYVPTGPGESRLFKAWHPIDDYNCYTFYIHFDFDKPIDVEAAYGNWGHRTSPPDYMTPHNLANMHLQDREQMKRGNFSGVSGAAIQDRVVQESMFPIVDRTKEHLGTSDKAVIFYRGVLLKSIEKMEKGEPLPGLDPSLDFNQRACSFGVASDRPWQDVLKVQEQYERSRGSTKGLVTEKESALAG